MTINAAEFYANVAALNITIAGQTGQDQQAVIWDLGNRQNDLYDRDCPIFVPLVKSRSGFKTTRQSMGADPFAEQDWVAGWNYFHAEVAAGRYSPLFDQQVAENCQAFIDALTANCVKLGVTEILMSGNDSMVILEGPNKKAFYGATLTGAVRDYRNMADGTPEIPTQISGLMWWLDFSARNTVLAYDAAQSIYVPVTADSTPIARILDRSGNGRTFSQSTTADQPLYRTNVRAGLSVARFDGTNDGLVSDATMSIPANFTLFAVARLNANVSGGIANADAINTGPSLFRMGLSNTSNFNCVGFDNAGGLGSINSQPAVATAFNILCLERDATTVQGFVNGESTGSSVVSGTANSGSSQVALGTLSGLASTYLDGDIAEIFMYDSALSAENRTAMLDYLAYKWGFPG